MSACGLYEGSNKERTGASWVVYGYIVNLNNDNGQVQHAPREEAERWAYEEGEHVQQVRDEDHSKAAYT